MRKFLDILTGVILVVVATAGLITLFVMFDIASRPAEAPPAQVLRCLELRIDEPLNETHPSAGGERYRRFECTEVPR